MKVAQLMVVIVIATLWQCTHAVRAIIPMRRILLKDAVESKVKP